MALNNAVTKQTAGAAIGQYKLVKVSGANVVVTTAATERVLGCSQADAADSGESLAITHGGRVKLKASGAITKGARVVPAADGEIAADAGTSTHIACGVALEAAAADGDVIEVLLDPSITVNA
jgi:hypothetical protein